MGSTGDEPAVPRERTGSRLSAAFSPQRRAGDRSPAWVWRAYAALAALALGYVVVELLGIKWAWLDGWGVSGFELVVGALCIYRAATMTRNRAIPILLGLGLWSWATGDIVLTIQSLGGATPPSPSLADGFYLTFYPVTYVGLMLLLRRNVRRFSLATWLDGGVAGFGAAALCATFAFKDVLHHADGSAAGVAINLAYPVGDVLLLGLVVGGAAIVSGRRKLPWLLLAAGYALITAGDMFNVLGTSSFVGTFLNAIAWPLSILLVSVAVWVQAPAARPSLADEPPGFALPALAAGAALLILFVGSLHNIGRVSLGLAAATLLIAGVRSAVSVIGLRSLTEERRRESVTDQLTGLGNRRALFRLLEAFLAEQRDPDAPARSLAFMFLDLDKFKEVNDSFGHPAGDELLRQLGVRLQDSVRASDLVVRLGGDEFAVALLDAGADYAATVAGRLTARIEEPFVLDAIRAQIGASIGIAVLPTDAGDAADLVRCADLAMYRAKLAGKRFAIYQEDLDGAANRMQLVEELRDAIEQRRLELHYQPQVNLANGQIDSVEALVRWNHARLGFIPPLEFIALAEDSGLMGALTALVLDEALAQCARWHAGGEQLTVAVNISASDLLDPEFPALVRRLLARHELPAGALVLEMTETTAIADFERSQLAIQELHDLGLIVSVDDFGAGFTSLAYLGSLAVKELKLDRSFITGLAETGEGRDLALVRATVELAHALGLRVVAEGVEDNHCLGLLTGLRCDLVQGYVISKPKPADELTLAPHALPALPARRAA
ncbi:MAG: bifunctional diguanylate cyclase/phosphodiesterase [Solirubrobacterales bacterium]|nr:bifunctional diguanylate cyclase/phosphodiesterase [Solirubrobacterales bacterium]